MNEWEFTRDAVSLLNWAPLVSVEDILNSLDI